VLVSHPFAKKSERMGHPALNQYQYLNSGHSEA
jgi:hypothetical protein